MGPGAPGQPGGQPSRPAQCPPVRTLAGAGLNPGELARGVGESWEDHGVKTPIHQVGSACLGLAALYCQPLSSLLPSGPRCSLCHLGTGPGALKPTGSEAGLLLTTPHSSCQSLVPQPREPPLLAGVTQDPRGYCLLGPAFAPLRVSVRRKGDQAPGLSHEGSSEPSRRLICGVHFLLWRVVGCPLPAPCWG